MYLEKALPILIFILLLLTIKLVLAYVLPHLLKRHGAELCPALAANVFRPSYGAHRRTTSSAIASSLPRSAISR